MIIKFSFQIVKKVSDIMHGSICLQQFKVQWFKNPLFIGMVL